MSPSIPGPPREEGLGSTRWADGDLAPPVASQWEELARAHRLLRRVTRTLGRFAGADGSLAPLSPVRCILLAHLRSASGFGLTPTRLARLMEMRISSLAHHLDVLEGSELVERRPRSLHDRRRVAVRLTTAGEDALRRVELRLEYADGWAPRAPRAARR